MTPPIFDRNRGDTNVHHHVHVDAHALVGLFARLATRADLVQMKEEIMGRLEDINAKLDALPAELDELQTAVDAVQQIVTDLRANGGGASDEQLATIEDKLTAVSERLTTVKTDVQTPV